MSTSIASVRSNYIPWLFVAGFAIVFLVNGLMIWFAIDSFSGLYGNGARNRETNYNEVIAQQKARDALGWKIETEWRTNEDRLLVDITQADGSALPGAVVTGQLVRPAEKRPYLPLEFHELASGRFVAHVALPARGNWDLDILVATAGQNFALTKRLFLR
jgi:nitrogen fixation protein FixH